MPEDSENTPKIEGVDLDSLPASVRDFIDLNNEMAGRETGRIKRFLRGDHAPGVDAEKAKERDFNALMRLLMNQAYAQLYYETESTITRAEEAVEQARRKLAQDSELAAERLQTMRDSTAVLDGKKVFRSKDKHIYTEDGQDVTAQAGSVAFPSNAASWEEYREAREKAERIEAKRREVETYQSEVIAPARERIADTNNPPKEKELKEIRSRIESAMPAAVRTPYENAASPAESAQRPVRDSAADRYLGAVELNAPELCAEFTGACGAGGSSNIRDPYGSQATPLPAGNPKKN